jgi:hypothetical protein
MTQQRQSTGAVVWHPERDVYPMDLSTPQLIRVVFRTLYDKAMIPGQHLDLNQRD